MTKAVKNSSGLTMVELIVVMLVLGILLTIAYPMIGPFSSGYRLRGAARELATDLQFARLLAVKENKSFRVDILPDSYQVVRVSDNLVVKSRTFSLDYPDINLGTITVIFDSRGNSSAATVVTVSNPTGTKNINVSTTGRVKLG